MATGFCSNCGAPRVAGAAFCPACGAPTSAAPPAQPGYPPPPQMPTQQPYVPPQHPAGHQPAAPGMSSNTKIGIAIALIAALVIGYFVWKNEQEFQRNRRAGQAPVATAPPPSTPAPPAQQGGAPARPADETQVGSEAWTRSRIIGRWGIGNCATSTHFRIDGTTFSTNGTQSLSGRWTYQNRRLVVVEPNATTDLELVSIGDDEMVTEFQGRQQRWRRC